MMARARARAALGICAALACLAPASCSTSAGSPPPCDDPSDHLVVLIAQAVPSATMIPCVRASPTGWTFGSGFVSKDLARMWLSSTVAGVNAVQASLTASCDPGDAVETVPGPGEAGAHVYQGPQSLDPFRWTRYVTFPGGCVVYEYRFVAGAPASLSLVANEAFSFVPRADVVEAVHEDVGEVLCGAGAPPCLAG
jgi:hypothetical protein